MTVAAVLRQAAIYNAWANDRLLRACAALGPDELAAPRTSFFPSIVATLNHVFIVDAYYRDALEGGGRGRETLAVLVPHPHLADLAAAQRASDRRLFAFVDALGVEDLARAVRIPRRDHVDEETVLATLLHLFNHQTHHRGQVHAMLAGTSVKPPQLDDFHLRSDLPLREAELRDLGLPIV